jgi:hypothetical protein
MRWFPVGVLVSKTRSVHSMPAEELSSPLLCAWGLGGPLQARSQRSQCRQRRDRALSSRWRRVDKACWSREPHGAGFDRCGTFVRSGLRVRASESVGTVSDHKPTVPLIVYLHADRLIPGHSRLSNHTRVPCTGEVVETDALATLLLASAVWSLSLQGLIVVEIFETSGAGWTYSRKDVELQEVKHEERPGLEGAILNNLRGEEILPAVVDKWSAERSTDPWHDCVREVLPEAVAAGYVREVQANGRMLARFLGGGAEFEPDCGRIASLQSRFDWFARAWKQFRDEESLLHERLLEQCRRSLLGATECWYP